MDIELVGTNEKYELTTLITLQLGWTGTAASLLAIYLSLLIYTNSATYLNTLTVRAGGTFRQLLLMS